MYISHDIFFSVVLIAGGSRQGSRSSFKSLVGPFNLKLKDF